MSEVHPRRRRRLELVMALISLVAVLDAAGAIRMFRIGPHHEALRDEVLAMYASLTEAGE